MDDQRDDLAQKIDDVPVCYMKKYQGTIHSPFFSIAVLVTTRHRDQWRHEIDDVDAPLTEWIQQLNKDSMVNL